MSKKYDLKVKIFADGADRNGIQEMVNSDFVAGFTTNPTLMKRSGVTHYQEFCLDVLEIVGGKPISFEVFSDDFSEMEKQAKVISSWGENVYVKIPVTNTRGEPSFNLIKRLAAEGVKVNATAIMTLDQVKGVLSALNLSVPSYISVFAGRIADTGIDPVPVMREVLTLMERMPSSELIWASPREVLNIVQADQIGCHVITVTNDILRKLDFLGYSLDEFSLDTVRMFYEDAKQAGFKI